VAKSKGAASIRLRQEFLQVIAIGASADGLEALQTVLTEIPSDCGLAFVVIQHLDPARRSVLRGLRSKVIPFPVLEISDGIALQPNHVYVVPPDKKAFISGGTLSLGPITSRDKRHPIDDFMASLAAERGAAASGVVLSGSGSDGTRGLAAIKAGGGITFAQDPETTQWPAMPLSAIKAGNVDFVLSPACIALELDRRVRSADEPPEPGVHVLRTLLAESESAMRALLDASPQAIFAVNAAGTIAWVNRTAVKMFGYEPPELLGQPLDILVPDSDRKRHSAHHANFFANPRTRPMETGLELQARRKNGTLFPVEIGLDFAETQAGALGLAFVTDITKRKDLERSIRQRESELAALFYCSPDSKARFDSDLRVTHANAAFEKAMGAPAQALIGKTVLQLPLSENNRRIADVLINKVFRTGQSQRFEFSVASTEGVTEYEVRYVPEFSADGSVAAVVGIGRDITEQKNMEQTLRQREGQLLALFDSSPDTLLRFDSNLRITHANAAFRKFFGLSAQAVVGETVHELPLPQRNIQIGERLIKSVFQTGQPQQHELSVPAPEGEIYHEVRFVPEVFADGSVAAVLAIGRDITERKQMERSLQHQEQELATLFDNSPDPIVRLDRNLRNLYVNAAWERLTGFSRERALGKTSEELGLPEDLVRLQKRNIRQVLKTRSPATVEITYLSQDGPVEHEVRHIPEFANGSVSSILIIGRDITDQKRLQTLAAANERDVRALTTSLITAQEHERRRVAREIHDSLCQHLGALAAEIGRVAAEFPASSLPGRHLQAARARAISAAEEAHQIAHQLHPAILEDLGLGKALQHLCRDLSKREGMPIVFRVINPLPEAPLEAASCVYRIAQEALNNVAKHAHAKNIWVRLSGPGNLQLSIRDDGIGFDPDAVRGVGRLGLVSMEERARIADATLSIKGRPGRGTLVKLSVPIRGATREKSAHSAGR
jgi:PAS domain S-box-containing protein